MMLLQQQPGSSVPQSPPQHDCHSHISAADSQASVVKATLSDYITASRYVRFNVNLGRRETWAEAVERTFTTYERKFKDKLSAADYATVMRVKELWQRKRLAGSMRSLQFGGAAVDVNNARAYNCWGIIIDSLDSLGNILWLLLSGGGVGFNLHPEYLAKLPLLRLFLPLPHLMERVYTVEDTIEGWADSVKALLHHYHEAPGDDAATDNYPVLRFDYSKIRPAGTPLVTSGGLAPGAEGLKKAHENIRALLEYKIRHNAPQLISTDILDINCWLADAVLSGGVRRSALLASFPFRDRPMLTAKTVIPVVEPEIIDADETGATVAFTYQDKYLTHRYDNLAEAESVVKTGQVAWFIAAPQRARANISALMLREETSLADFTEVIEATKSWGEPGFIFADSDLVTTNPCGEIQFLPITPDGRTGAQACNLVSLNGAAIKDADDFMDLVEAGTILGTLQASLTDFPYLTDASEELTREEALVGLSISGILENSCLLLDEALLQKGAAFAVSTNVLWSAKLGINPAARVTTIKPDGTVPLVFGSFASGIHPAHASAFFKRVEANRNEAPFKLFSELNPQMVEPARSKNSTDAILVFPISLTRETVVKKQLTAVDHLAIIKTAQLSWVNPGRNPGSVKPLNNSVSCTVIVKPEEWAEVTGYLYQHRAEFSSVALFPYSGDKDYPQAPNEEVITYTDWVKFNGLLDSFVPVDFTQLREDSDTTTPIEIVACSGGICEL